ncbi:MAG: FHA domain-containing protein FhaB/FipA [Candidatus Geothermincolia bacterium]
MIPNIVFIALRYVFIGLLYIFLILVVRAIYKDIRQPDGAPRPARRKKNEQPQLIVITADRNVGAKYMLTDDVRVGRAANSNILIDDTYASQQHARIYSNEESYYVEDLGSTNGTYVNGRKISYPLELRAGDRIKIGKTVFEFRR